MGRSTTTANSNDLERFEDQLFYAIMRFWSAGDFLRLLEERRLELDYHDAQQKMVDRYRNRGNTKMPFVG